VKGGPVSRHTTVDEWAAATEAGATDERHPGRPLPDAAAFAYPMVRAAVEEALRAGASRGATPSIIADFGSGAGDRSLAGLKVAVQSWQRRVNAAPLLVAHSDVPGADFATLFDTVDRSADSYLLGSNDGVYPLVAGRSPFQRAFPARSLAFGWTASSLHRVSSAPAPIPDHFFVHLSANEAARATYRDRSARDWRAFLDHRCAEMAPGCGIVVVDGVRGDDGLIGCERLFGCLAQAIAQARADGMLTTAETIAAGYPAWFRSLPELGEPFSPAFMGSAGGTLEWVETRTAVLADPFAELLVAGRFHDYADSQVRVLRSLLEPHVGEVPSPRHRRDAAWAAVWADTRERIARNPHAVAPVYRMVAIRLRKKG